MFSCTFQMLDIFDIMLFDIKTLQELVKTCGTTSSICEKMENYLENTYTSLTAINRDDLTIITNFQSCCKVEFSLMIMFGYDYQPNQKQKLTTLRLWLCILDSMSIYINYLTEAQPQGSLWKTKVNSVIQDIKIEKYYTRRRLRYGFSKTTSL